MVAGRNTCESAAPSVPLKPASSHHLVAGIGYENALAETINGVHKQTRHFTAAAPAPFEAVACVAFEWLIGSNTGGCFSLSATSHPLKPKNNFTRTPLRPSWPRNSGPKRLPTEPARFIIPL